MKLNVIILIISLITQLYLLTSSIFRESPTYDESIHINAGYGFIVDHDFRLEPFNTPLARELIAIPVTINNDLVNDPVFFWQRMIVVLFALSLTTLVYIFALKLFGQKSAYVALVLFIFESNMLTHGHYATTDTIGTFFLILALYFYWVWQDKFDRTKVMLFGVLCGLALASRISSLPFLMISLSVLLVLKHGLSNISRSMTRKSKIVLLAIFIVSLLTTIWSTYFFTWEPLLGNRFDPKRPAIELAKKNRFIHFALTQPLPLGSYISTVKQGILYNTNMYEKNSMLLGKVSQEGFPFYFLFTFIMKTSIPILILILATFYFVRKKVKYQMILIIPILVIVGFTLFSKINIGVRYILPIYPLIIIFISQSILHFKKKEEKILLYTLLMWHVLGTLLTYPHYITFFNEFSGGSNNGHKFLVDSNYDWGHGLIDLREYQEENILKNLQLAYFGSVDPGKYSLKYTRIKDKSIADPSKVYSPSFDKNAIFAISATCWYYCGYYKNKKFEEFYIKDIVGSIFILQHKTNERN